MATISDLEVLVLDRLEESRSNPQFWQVQNELRPIIVEMLNEAALITGEPQVRSDTLFTITANTRFFTLPTGSFVLLRMESQNSVQKTSVKQLDWMHPGWEGETAPVTDNTIKNWFPFGFGQFGVYPLLQMDSQVYLTTVQMPVETVRPYQGTEVIPYLTEYLEGIVQGAAHVARLKEGGREFADSIKEYESFLSKMQELSKFLDRKDILRFSRTVGARSDVTDVRTR